MEESIYIHNSHNVSNLVYHFVCPTKYRRVVVTEGVDECVKQTRAGIEERYGWISFLEIGADKDHVHFLIQPTPNYSPAKIITTVKSVTAKRVFAERPEVKKQLWGGAFWSDGYFVASVGRAKSEEAVRQYVKSQGKQDEYEQLSLKL